MSKLKGSHGEIARLYLSGLSAEKIAQRFETHHTTILEALKKQGIPRRRGGWNHRPGDTQFCGWSKEAIMLRNISYTRWAEMYQSGMTIQQIARIESRNLETVRRGLIRTGVTMRLRGGGVCKAEVNLDELREKQLRAVVARKVRASQTNAKIERMMHLACPRRRRYAA